MTRTKDLPSASRPPVRRLSSTMRNFTGSLLLLVLALIVFGVIMYPRHRGGLLSEARDTTGGKDDAALNAVKRQSLRHAPVSDAAVADDGAAPAGDPAGGATARRSEPHPGDKAADVGDPDVQRAINMIDSGQVSEAVALLEALLKKDPRNESALVELAMINLLDLKQPEQAMGYLQRVMEVNPQNQVVLSELVSLYEEQNRLEEGLTFLMDVNSKQPNAPDLSYGIGQMLALQGRDAEAITYLEKATGAADNIRAYRDLAEAYARSGEPERALDAYGKAITNQEKDIAEKSTRGVPVTFAEERLNYTKLDMARQLMGMGDFDRAQALLEDVGRAMPGDDSVLSLQEQIRRKRAG